MQVYLHNVRMPLLYGNPYNKKSWKMLLYIVRLRKTYFAPSTKRTFKTNHKKIKGIAHNGNFAILNTSLIKGIVIVRVSKVVAMTMLQVNFLFEKIL